MRPSARSGMLVCLVIATACGSVAQPSAQGSPADPATMPVLASAAVPGIPSKTSVLTQVGLSREASLPELASLMTAWGFVAGRERIFQGESRHLTLVVSRSLLFADAGGAGSFVTYVKANSSAFFGGVVGIQPLVAQGRSGWLFTPQGCACHMANPAVAGVVDSGAGVVWLEINGPDATPALLVNLLDPQNSAPAA